MYLGFRLKYIYLGIRARFAREGNIDTHTSRWWFVLRIGTMNEIYGKEDQWTWKAIS